MNQNHLAFHLAVPVDVTDHVLGPHLVRTTLVEYGDFECPDCKRAFPAVQMLLRHFEDRMRFIYRHFPLTEVHPQAELAAEAAEAAGAQGKFWEMHAKLFENQPHLQPKQLRHYAEELGLDLVRYDAEMGDHIYLQRVQEHIQGGKRSGVRGTPTFYLDGAIMDASAGMEEMVKHVEKTLKAHPHP